MSNINYKKNAFTLIELLIVTAIISILTLVSTSVYYKYINSTKMSSVAYSLQTIRTELVLCFQKQSGSFNNCSKSENDLLSFTKNEDVKSLTVVDGVISLEFNIIENESGENYKIKYTPDVKEGRFVRFTEYGNFCNNPSIICKNRVFTEN